MSINIPGTPTLPNIGYYDTDKDGPSDNPNNDVNFTSFNNLQKNLTSSCINTSNPSWNKTKGIYDSNDTLLTQYLPNGTNTNSLDVPYYLAKSGVLMTNPKNVNNNLAKAVSNSCQFNKDALTNQIQYLTCQLQKCANVSYDSGKYIMTGNITTVRTTFELLPSLKIVFIITFFISMYLAISGFFGSLDLAGNIFNAIDKNSEFSVTYWIGVLIGLIIPVFILCSIYASIVCSNLSDLEKYDITNNAYGIKTLLPSQAKNLDILTLCLFIFLIYSFVGVLFTIKRRSYTSIVYTALVGSVLFIISTFIYVLYAFIPFFDTTDSNNMMRTKSRPLSLFIDQQETPSNITTNQDDDAKIRKAFFRTFIFIAIIAILFFVIKPKGILNGILASSAILILPLLWVFNFIMVTSFFYLFPIIMITLRFIRSLAMSILYVCSRGSLKDKFSEDLANQLENFKNYSPSWGLIGVDFFKLILNMSGYENIFSKEIIPEDNNSKNISNNKFVSSGMFTFLFQFIVNKDLSNVKGIILNIVILILTLTISSIILFGVVKVQDI